MSMEQWWSDDYQGKTEETRRKILTGTVAERSKTYTVFGRSEAGIVGSNPTQGMDVWCALYVYSVFMLSCV
jgi:hypothetical protein